MTIRYIRREKTGNSSIETRLYGPITDKVPPASAGAQDIQFVDAKITELDAAGVQQTVIRTVGKIDVESGEHYLLSWTMWGDLDAKVEYLIGNSAAPAPAKFSSVASDKIPAAGDGLDQSRSTPSGKLIWINSKIIGA